MRILHSFRAMTAITLFWCTHSPAHTAQPENRDYYQAVTNDCSVQLHTQRKGRIIINGWLENFSLFSEISTTRAWTVDIHFQCLKKNAEEYCPTTWTEAVVEHDPVVLKRIDVRRYDFQHPRYYSLVYASSFNNADPPRSRDLYFCLGDESRTLLGNIPIGDEKTQFPTQALKIINTLVIHPTVNAQTHP